MCYVRGAAWLAEELAGVVIPPPNAAACRRRRYASTWIDSPAVPRELAYVLWPLYWFWQGAFATGIWVISHECGHGAFSKSPVVNDAVGLVFHSLLLVPYYSWWGRRRCRNHCMHGWGGMQFWCCPPSAGKAPLA